MHRHIEEVLAGPGSREPRYLRSTGWLGPTCELERLYEDFEADLAREMAAVATNFGAPAYTVKQCSHWWARWYPEAFAGAAWERGKHLLVLAAEHHDRETPISLVAFKIAASDITDS